LHKLLTDGVARSQGRKIIFTTNLADVTDIDEALIRPGRCFAIRNLRNLTTDEARARAAAVRHGRAARREGGAGVVRRGGEVVLGGAGLSRLQPGYFRLRR
jgi:hypothetical protein